jgi:hypothetical protein
VSEKTNGNKAK